MGAVALTEIYRAKAAFFSKVSDEFRTPLTLMLGQLEDQLAEGGLTPPTRERPLLHLFWRLSTEWRRTARLLRDMVQILPSLSGLPGKPILTGRFIAHRISSLTAPTLYRGLEQVEGRVCLQFFIAARTRSPRRAFSAQCSF